MEAADDRARENRRVRTSYDLFIDSGNTLRRQRTQRYEERTLHRVEMEALRNPRWGK